jgi:glyoxylase I family protein
LSFADLFRRRTIAAMPAITGEVIATLTVTDPSRSGDWYRDLLGMHEESRHVQSDGHVGQVCLIERRSGLRLCLVDHASSNSDPFDERRTGLDHLEFLVDSRDELTAWVGRLDELAIINSGVKEPSYTSNAMITFRDPDNIQLEFFWLAPVTPPD